MYFNKKQLEKKIQTFQFSASLVTIRVLISERTRFPWVQHWAPVPVCVCQTPKQRADRNSALVDDTKPWWRRFVTWPFGYKHLPTQHCKIYSPDGKSTHVWHLADIKDNQKINWKKKKITSCCHNSVSTMIRGPVDQVPFPLFGRCTKLVSSSLSMSEMLLSQASIHF